MKKLLLILFVCVMFHLNSVQAASEITKLEKAVKAKKQDFKEFLLELRNGTSIFNALKELKNKFNIFLDKAKIVNLLEDLQKEIKKECDFIATDYNIKNDSSQSEMLDQLIEKYMMSLDQSSIQQEIQNKISPQLNQLLREKRILDLEISKLLRPYTRRIAEIIARIKNAVANSPESKALKNQIAQIRLRSDFRHILNAKRKEFEFEFKELEENTQALYLLKHPCIEVAVGQFMSDDQFLDTVIDGIISMLIP